MKRLKRPPQIPNEQDFRIDVGRAVDAEGKPCSFMRVIHLPTGKSRQVLGLKGRSNIAYELAMELLAELNERKARDSNPHLDEREPS